MPGEPLTGVKGRRRAAAHETAPVDPHHYGPCLAVTSRRVDVQVEAVLRLFGGVAWYRTAGIGGRLDAHRRGLRGLAGARPWRRTGGRAEPEVADRRCRIRDAAEDDQVVGLAAAGDGPGSRLDCDKFHQRWSPFIGVSLHRGPPGEAAGPPALNRRRLRLLSTTGVKSQPPRVEVATKGRPRRRRRPGTRGGTKNSLKQRRRVRRMLTNGADVSKVVPDAYGDHPFPTPRGRRRSHAAGDRQHPPVRRGTRLYPDVLADLDDEARAAALAKELSRDQTQVNIAAETYDEAELNVAKDKRLLEATERQLKRREAQPRPPRSTSPTLRSRPTSPGTARPPSSRRCSPRTCRTARASPSTATR